jgi:hypothetical protein
MNKHTTTQNIRRSVKLSALALVAGSALWLSGCAPEADTSMAKVRPQQASRFAVERVGVFEDDLAYGNRRGIYVITDKTTGREYIGVSGVGVSELGSHQAGKTRVSDER